MASLRLRDAEDKAAALALLSRDTEFLKTLDAEVSRLDGLYRLRMLNRILEMLTEELPYTARFIAFFLLRSFTDSLAQSPVRKLLELKASADSQDILERQFVFYLLSENTLKQVGTYSFPSLKLLFIVGREGITLLVVHCLLWVTVTNCHDKT